MDAHLNHEDLEFEEAKYLDAMDAATSHAERAVRHLAEGYYDDANVHANIAQAWATIAGVHGVCSCIPTGAARLLDAAGEGMR